HATARPAREVPVTESAVQPPEVVTLLWIDSATGQVTRTWSGSPAAAAVLRGPADSPRITAAGRRSDNGAAPLTRRSYDCSDPNSYWNVRNYPPLVCFADAGDIDVLIYRAYEVDSGNNVGSFTYTTSIGYRRIQYLPRWTSALFSSRVT